MVITTLYLKGLKMVTIYEKAQPTHFRIQIYDLIEKKSKTISILNHKDHKLEDIYNIILTALKESESKKKSKSTVTD